MEFLFGGSYQRCPKFSTQNNLFKYMNIKIKIKNKCQRENFFSMYVFYFRSGKVRLYCVQGGPANLLFPPSSTYFELREKGFCVQLGTSRETVFFCIYSLKETNPLNSAFFKSEMIECLLFITRGKVYVYNHKATNKTRRQSQYYRSCYSSKKYFKKS